MVLQYIKNTVTLKLDPGKCIGCGMCISVCPHEVFSLDCNNRAKIIDIDMCMECGACAMNCPVSAISVRSGVGCAYGILSGRIKGKDVSDSCSCSDLDCC